MWRFPRSFVVMMGGEAVSGGGVLSCICLAPQLVCGCSTRAPLAFFLAWGGWRQRGGCAGFLCRTGQVTVRERGRGRWVCFREEGTSVKGAGSGRGGGEVRDLKSGVVGWGEGLFSPQSFFDKLLENDCRLVVLHTPPPHTEIRTQNHNKDMDLNIKGFDTNQHTVELGVDDTVEDLRRKVATAMGLPEDGFCMSFGDEALGEGADMTQLSAGDTIILTKKSQKQEAIAELHALGVTDITAEKLESVRRDPEVACLLLQAEVATVIPNYFLAYTSLTRLDLSAESIVTHIRDSFLSCCTSLTSIDISGLSNVTQVGEGFLQICNSLTTLDLSALSKVTQINKAFLAGCTSLTNIDLSPLNNVTQVGASFLLNCSSLTTLDLSPLSNVTSIRFINTINSTYFASTLFAAKCTSLTSIYLSGCSSVVSNEVRNGELSKLVVEARPKRSRDESPEQSQKRQRHAQ